MAVIIPEQNMSQFSGLVKRIDGLSERCLAHVDVGGTPALGDLILNNGNGTLTVFASKAELVAPAAIVGVYVAEETMLSFDGVVVADKLNIGDLTLAEARVELGKRGIVPADAMSEYKYGQL